jgi:hypothetical protein
MTKITIVTISFVSFVILSATLANVLVSSASYTPTITIVSSGMVLQSVPAVNAVVHKALFSWGGVPSSYVDHIAQFDWDYLGPEDAQLIPSIRAENPKIIIIGYFDVIVGNANTSYPETCYFHNASGNRIYFPPQGWNPNPAPFMNISDPTWQSICINSTKEQVAQGFDGVMADDTWSNYFRMYGLTTEPAPSGAWWNSYDSGASYTRWQTAMRTLLAGMQVAIGANKIVCCNGGSSVYYDVCAAANLEDFVFGGGADAMTWINILEAISTVEKYVIAHSGSMADNETNYIFGLSCYMLGMNGTNTYFSGSNIWHPSMGIYPSIINRDFGKPLGSKVQVSANAWKREFENCTVTVDFSSQTGQIVMK